MNNESFAVRQRTGDRQGREVWLVRQNLILADVPAI
jgi:hypothetical protein